MKENMNKLIECQWFSCNKPATVRVIKADSCVCDEHYVINTIQFGCDFTTEPVNEKWLLEEEQNKTEALSEVATNYVNASQAQRRLVREEYVKIQKGMCHHCGSPLTEAPTDIMERYEVNGALFPKGFFKYPVHLHHDHNTDMTIGAVHNYCNAVLWQYFGE